MSHGIAVQLGSVNVQEASKTSAEIVSLSEVRKASIDGTDYEEFLAQYGDRRHIRVFA